MSVLRYLLDFIIKVKRSQGGFLNILVVDDDELIRESMVPMLEIMGHQAQAAAGGQEALDLLRGGLEVDVVILDMNMPGLNGTETLVRIKADRPGQVVLMASGGQEGVTGALADLPGVHHILKPFTLRELGQKLAGL